MAHEWATHELSEFISIKHGFAFKGEYFKDRETRDYLMTPGNFAIGGGFKGDKFKYYDGPVPEDYILQKGDLIITMTDLSKETDTLGYSALVPSISGRRLLHNQRVGLVEFKNAELDKMFLYFLLRSREYRHHVVSGATGTTVKHTSPTKIVSFQFRKPPLHMQKIIGERLIAIEEKIQLNRQTNQTLEAMAQALFKSWFVDFDPVIDNALAAGHEIPPELQARAEARKSLQARAEQRKASLSGDRPEQESGDILPESIRQLFPNRFVLDAQMGWIPEGWEIGTFKDIANHIRVNIKPENINDSDIYVGLEHIRKKQVFLTEHGSGADVESNKSGFKTNDLLFGKLRPYFHKVCLAPKDGICSTDILVFRAKQSCYHSFMALTAYTESFVEYADLRSTGTRMPRASAKDMLAYQIVLPPKDLAVQFENIVQPVWNRGFASVVSSDEAAKLRDTILPKLISGELRLPEPDTQPNTSIPA